jgi:hypothetical protein
MRPALSFHDSSLTPDGGKLLAEVESFIAHPRAAEILLNDWLHDAALPIPSPELIAYFSLRLLGGNGSILEKVATLDRFAAAQAIVDAFREESPAERLASIERCRRRIECLKLLVSGRKGSFNPHMAEWLPVLEPFLHPGTSPLSQGFRSLSRGVLEAMVLRAVFHYDVKRLEALTTSLRVIRDGQEIIPPHAQRIAAEVIRWLPWLQENLRRFPTKEEFKTTCRSVTSPSWPPTSSSATRDPRTTAARWTPPSSPASP